MNIEASGRMQQIDHYEIHKENMKRLQVTAPTRNLSRSAPNSPMMNRSKPDQKNAFLSPLVQRKDTQMSEENRSRSLNHLTKDGVRSRSSSPSIRSLSPGESPIGSPMSVSDRIIRTHYLSNTTGTPGSYLLKKSDEIVKEIAKRSPSGSPKMVQSPGLVKKGAINNKQHTPAKSEAKTIHPLPPPPATIVISPAEEKSVIGFEIQEKSKELSKRDDIIRQKSKLVIDTDKKISFPSKGENKHINLQTETEAKSDIRESIGLALSKPKLPLSKPVELPAATSKENTGKNKKASKKEKKKVTKSKQEKEHRHHYIKYGDTHKNPGLLSPPTEPRGSKDLSAEMENMFQKKKERRLFEDLDHLEEVSIATSSEDHEESLSVENEDDNAVKKPPAVFTMPAVFDSIPTQLQARDYSIPISLEDREMNEEEWEKMKQCRYLRIEDSESENNESKEEFSLSDDDEEKDEADE